jgi:energy-coupling factor transporter ATP-binding protein EcfA2
MLKLFEVDGFKNFNHKISLDFSQVRDYRFNPQCVANDTLKDVIIYGKNGIGKTNIGLALFDVVSHLTGKNVTPGLYDYYINHKKGVDHAEFHYIFQFGPDVVEYQYSKKEMNVLLKETLTLNDSALFDYDYILKSGNLAGLKEFAPTLNWTYTNGESLLKYAINNTIEDFEHPLFKMMNFVSNMLWFRNLDEKRYIGYTTKSDDYRTFIFDDEVMREFETLLANSGIHEKLAVIEENDGVKRLYFAMDTPLPFFPAASNGTKALYAFFYWHKTTPNVSLMFIDEFDAYYHFELSESLVKLLEKMPNTQVILTSHNTNLLTNRIMRPDCYFILTQERMVSFADATKRELREGHNLEKLYMSGEFGE